MKTLLSKIDHYFFNSDVVLSGKRLSWIDYAKGIAIFLVVYHHAFLGLLAAGLKVAPILININMIVYSFRVPLFFILSGLFIQKGLQKRGIKKYIAYRSKILLYPYILWAVLQIGIQYFFQSYANFPWSPKLFIYILYEPKYTGQLWYLLALFNASVIYVLSYTRLKIRGKGHLIIGTILYLLAPALSFNSLLQQLCIFYIYLAIGTLISGYILNVKNKRLFSSFKSFFILLPFFLGSQYYFLHHEKMDPFFMSYNQEGFSFMWLWYHDITMLKYLLIVLIGCAITINICFMLQTWGKASFLRVIGFHSLYIYLMHLFLLVIIRTVFLYFLHINNTYIILPIQLITTVIASIMIYNISLRLGLKFLFEFDFSRVKNLLKKIIIIPNYQKI